MCCFSPVSAPAGLLARLFRSEPRVKVADTRIFARHTAPGEQALVYSMRLSVAGDVAMILPIPVVAGGGEQALTFVDLAKYPTLFDDMETAFYMVATPLSRGGGGLGFVQARPKLVVHEVGSFIASYVPSRGDFDRLDPRFRLPDAVWSAMKRYHDWGFAVFQLERGRKKRIHPMAFRFRTRDPGRLFFPTVHVHDGRVHPTAQFDHVLYFQQDVPAATPPGFGEVSWAAASKEVDIERTAGLVDGDQLLRRKQLEGELPNEDTWIAAPPAPSSAAA